LDAINTKCKVEQGSAASLLAMILSSFTLTKRYLRRSIATDSAPSWRSQCEKPTSTQPRPKSH